MQNSAQQPFLLIMDNSTATILYFQALTPQRNKRPRLPPIQTTAPTKVEHNLSSVRRFHNHPDTPNKLSTFHRDTRKATVQTDRAHLETITTSINQIRENYTTFISTRKHKSDIQLIKKLILKITQTRFSLDKKQLSRRRLNKIRNYLDATKTRLKTLTKKIEEKQKTKNKQRTITQLFNQYHTTQ